MDHVSVEYAIYVVIVDFVCLMTGSYGVSILCDNDDIL